MTEQEWYELIDPMDVLDALGGVPESSLWEYVRLCLLALGEKQSAEILHRWLAGSVSQTELRDFRDQLEIRSRATSGGGYSMGRKPKSVPVGAQRAKAGLAALGPTARFSARRVTEVTRHQLQRLQCAWLRCLFPNPFRPVAFDPRWRTSTAVGLAQSMYDARDFGAMPILADALQDAGCEDDSILHHCRDLHQQHVRGCWVVDLVLGKS